MYEHLISFATGTPDDAINAAIAIDAYLYEDVLEGLKQLLEDWPKRDNWDEGYFKLYSLKSGLQQLTRDHPPTDPQYFIRFILVHCIYRLPVKQN